MADYLYDTSWSEWTTGTSTCTSNTDTDTTSSTATDNVWTYWTIRSSSIGGTVYYRDYQEPPETAEARQQRIEIEQQRERERQAAAAADLKQREEAVAKAERLLLESLKEKQREEYQEFKRFTVISKDGKRTYRINRHRSQNVQLIDPKGNVLKTYCAHPAEYVPDADTMLAQKLLLEHEEERFLKVANAS